MPDTPSISPAHAARMSGRLAIPRWSCCSVGLVLLVFGLRWLLSMHALPGDAWAARLGASSKPWIVFAITRVYQQIGRPLVAVGEVLAMLAWLWSRSGRQAARGLLIALLASATCGLIKIVCGPTPLWLDLHHIGTNFPSGVVTFVTATGGYMAAIARREGRRLLPLAFVLVIVGAGPARVLGGQHLLSDVVGAYMLGTAWLIVACRYAAVSERGPQTASWRIPALEATAASLSALRPGTVSFASPGRVANAELASAHRQGSSMLADAET